MKNKNYLFSKSFITICFINFVMNMGQFMVNTILPKYAADLGATPVIVGMVASIFSLTSIITKPFSGPAIDAFRKKYILCFGCIFLMLAYVGYAFSSSVPFLLASRLIHGIAMGITVIACLSMLSDALPEDKLTTGISYYSMVQAVATAIGPAVGLRICEWFGYRYAFLISCCLVILAIFLALRWDVAEKGEKIKFALTLHTCVAIEAIPPATIMMCLAAAYINISSYLVLFAESINVPGIEIYFTVYAITILFSRPLVGKLSEKYGTLKLLSATILLFSAGLILIGFSKDIVSFIITAVIVGFGYGASQPLVQALCIQSVPPERRGSASATSYYGTDLGYLLAPVITGQIVASAGYESMFFVASLFPLFGLFLLFCMKKRFH